MSSLASRLVERNELQGAIDDAILRATQKVSSPYSPPVNARGYPCGAPGCTRDAYAAGYCNAHYIRLKKGMDMSSPIRARKREGKCSVCGKISGAKGGWGMCQKHYRSARYAVIKDALIEAMGGKCSKCNGTFQREVFDFHHVMNKSDSPSAILINKSSAEIAAELSGCVLLCANCHRLEHANELRPVL